MAGCDPYSREILLKILHHFAARRKVMLACLVALGCGVGSRISELLALKRGDLIRNGCLVESVRLVKLKVRRKPNGHRYTTPRIREVPLTAALAPYVSAWLVRQQELGIEFPEDYVFSRTGVEPLTRQAVYYHLRDAYRALLLHGRHGTHGMRKTFARFVFDYYRQEFGDDLRALEQTRTALGHERIDTTIKYLNLGGACLGSALSSVFGFITEDDDGERE